MLSIIKIISIFKFYFMFYVHICLCTAYSYGGQKRATNHLELELEMIVSHGVASENQTSVLWRSSQCSLPLELSLYPLCFKILSLKEIRIAEELTKMSILGTCIKTRTNLSWDSSLCVWITVLVSWCTFIVEDYLNFLWFFLKNT